MASKSTKLDIAAREAANSRENRRLRRAGKVPGVLYGGSGDPVPFSVDERLLRHALAARGAVLELSVDGGSGQAAVLKDAHRPPVRGQILHVDLLRVDLNQPITSGVTVELVGGEDAPGVRDGGILEHVNREVQVEALPADIPDTLQVDVSGMEMNGTLTLAEVTAPSGVTLLDDGETVIASITPPSVEPVEEEIETETEVVGEGEAAEGEAGEAEGEGGEEPSAEAPADAE
ncbi:MAG: 50S ribosomal protein L25 [Solirubrobacterales bacterium]|nr:50S ribosomal protein L25 [Solirubrobacterales bacterium]